jgi:hypothetical protein
LSVFAEARRKLQILLSERPVVVALDLNSVYGFKQGLKDDAFPTHLHLFSPASSTPALAHCAVEKPAEITGLDLPNEAFVSHLNIAVLLLPAGLGFNGQLLLEIR